ncbi:dicarboxylate/amino acid:cation symporter [Brevundimonas sp.]|uniref:dicarboxylate/amino acid:cation symporter n=1 Tax=Brevundimonas sp. TaxID=1871086 RepID=UPI0035B08CC4
MTISFSAAARSLSLRVLVALALGLGLGGLLASTTTVPDAVVEAVRAVGGLWLSALQMTVAPLVFSALVTGIAAASDAAATGRLAARAVALFIGLVALVAALTLIAIPAILAVWPVNEAGVAALMAGAGGAGEAPTAPEGGFAAWLSSLAPGNPIRAAAEDAMLPLVVFGVFFGFAVTRLPAEQKRSLVGLFEALTAAMITIVRWVLLAAPIGVFALAFVLALRGGIASAGPLLHYIVLAVGACLATLVISYPLAVGVGRAGLARFARACAPVQAVAFSTQSSLACLPVMLERARDDLGISERTAGVVLPMAVAIFRITSPAANLTVALFIAHVSGIQPGFGALVAAGLVSIAVSIATVGLPGQASFFASLAPICLALGVPMELLPLLLAVEVIPDIFRTVGNVTADMAVTSALARGEADEPVSAEIAAV